MPTMAEVARRAGVSVSTVSHVVNRTRFGNPNANLNASTFGVISSQANTPRQMQVALKLYW